MNTKTVKEKKFRKEQCLSLNSENKIHTLKKCKLRGASCFQTQELKNQNDRLLLICLGRHKLLIRLQATLFNTKFNKNLPGGRRGLVANFESWAALFTCLVSLALRTPLIGFPLKLASFKGVKIIKHYSMG